MIEQKRDLNMRGMYIRFDEIDTLSDTEIDLYKKDICSYNGYLNIFRQERNIGKLLQLFSLCEEVNPNVKISNFFIDSVIGCVNDNKNIHDGFFVIYNSEFDSLIFKYMSFSTHTNRVQHSWYYFYNEIRSFLNNNIQFTFDEKYNENKFKVMLCDICMSFLGDFPSAYSDVGIVRDTLLGIFRLQQKLFEFRKVYQKEIEKNMNLTDKE